MSTTLQAPAPQAAPPATPAVGLTLAHLARWGRGVPGVVLTLIGIIGWLATTGATLWSLPAQQAALSARTDSLAAVVSANQRDAESYRRLAGQENRAQTCMLRQMAAGKDPEGCSFFLPQETGYYEPPSAR